MNTAATLVQKIRWQRRMVEGISQREWQAEERGSRKAGGGGGGGGAKR